MIAPDTQGELGKECLPGLEQLTGGQLGIECLDGDIKVVFQSPGDRLVQGQAQNVLIVRLKRGQGCADQ